MTLDADVTDLAARLRTSHPEIAEHLDSLQEAIQPDGDPSGWSGVDVFEVLDPEGVAQDERNRALRDRGLALRERLRNVFALLPVPLTWLGLMYAAVGYNATIAARPDLITRPLLLLWEQGFDDLVPAPWALLGFLTFSHVAICDVVILSIVLLLTWQTHSEINVRQTQREQNARALERDLRRVAGAAALLFARRTSPRASDDRSRQTLEALLDELRAERDRGAQVAVQREREAADLRTFGSEFRIGAQDLKRITAELGTAFDAMLTVNSNLDYRIGELSRDERSVDQSLAQLAEAFERFGTLQQSATEAIIEGGKHLTDAADRSLSSSSTIASGLDRLETTVKELGEQNRLAASSQTATARLMDETLEASTRSIDELQRATEEIKNVLAGLVDLAPRLHDAAAQQAGAVDNLAQVVQQFLGIISAQGAGVTRAMEQFGVTAAHMRETVDGLSEQLITAGVVKPKRRRGGRILWIIPAPWRKEPVRWATGGQNADRQRCLMLQGLGRFRDSNALAGWLFADFMLALAMLFIIANTVGQASPPESPTITGFSPTSGPVRTQVRISGTNFRDVQEVQFGNARAVRTQVDSESQVTAEVPEDATTGLITVVTAHGIATSTGPFTVTVIPTPTPTLTRTPTQTPSPTQTPPPTITPTPSPTPCQTTLDFHLQEIFVPAGPGGGTPSEQDLRDAFAPYANQEAGLVIAYGQSLNQGTGQTLASNAYTALKAALPDTFTDKTVFKPQHDTSSDSHRIEFDVLFFATRCNA